MTASFKKILVPIDGSIYSEKSLERACDFADAFGSSLILIYVVEKSIPINLLDRKRAFNRFEFVKVFLTSNLFLMVMILMMS